MSIFDWFRKKEKKQQTTNQVEATAKQTENFDPTMAIETEKINFFVPISEDEKELVSVIASAIAVGDYPDSHIRVKNVVAIDTEKEIVTIIAAAIAAKDYPESHFQLKSIQKIN